MFSVLVKCNKSVCSGALQAILSHGDHLVSAVLPLPPVLSPGYQAAVGLQRINVLYGINNVSLMLSTWDQQNNEWQDVLISSGFAHPVRLPTLKLKTRQQCREVEATPHSQR